MTHAQSLSRSGFFAPRQLLGILRCRRQFTGYTRGRKERLAYDAFSLTCGCREDACFTMSTRREFQWRHNLRGAHNPWSTLQPSVVLDRDPCSGVSGTTEEQISVCVPFLELDPFVWRASLTGCIKANASISLETREGTLLRRREDAPGEGPHPDGRCAARGLRINADPGPTTNFGVQE